MTIWKYPLETTDHQTVIMPNNAEILTVGVQFGKPCLWVKVEQTNSQETINIATYGTGHLIAKEDEKLDYIGTYQLHEGQLIFHVFKIT